MTLPAAYTHRVAPRIAYHYTGKERDQESGNDYFGARYYGSNMGRWMSPDWSANPSAVPYASLPYPQSLNLYSYVQNNPLSRIDPDGHNWWDKFKNLFTDSECWCEGAKAAESAQKNRQIRAEKEAAARAFANSPEGRFFVTVSQTIGFSAVIGPLTGGALDPISAPEDEAVPGVASEAAAGTEAGAARTMVNGVPQPNPAGETIVGPNGTAVKIPPGYVAEPARADGIVYRPAGSTGDANTIRVMGANATQGPRVIMYNSSGQPINPATLKPGPAAQTHVPLN